MTTVCPKCRAMRPADTQAPAWQCPVCGVAYAKAGLASEPRAPPPPPPPAPPPPRRPGRARGTVVGRVGRQWWGHHAQLHKRDFGALLGGGDMDEAAVQRLAATVRAEQIVMYSTNECGYCTQTRSWLSQHGFAFTECNMSREARCVDEFRALQATGTPYLIVRGPRGAHHMKDGFDSDELLKALKA